MFPNQISTRELLSGSQSMQDHSRDFSQLQSAQYTQFDMSQTCSQDFYSQPEQYSAGSNQDVQSQERKVPSYEKYMSKPLFGTNNKGRVSGRNTGQLQNQTHSRPMANQKPCQQQMNAFKNRTKEKEERDMLSSIVCIVKECSDEVKQNLYSLKEADQDTGDMLKKAVEKLSSTVEDSSNKILKAIHSREKLHTQHLDLQQDIRKKDDKIQELLRQSSKFCMKEVTKSMQDAVKAFLEDQQSATEYKLQKIMDTAKEQLKFIQDIGSCQKSGQEDSKKQHTDLKYTNERQVQDIEKRLQIELGLLRDDLDRQRRDMENFCKNQIQSVHQKYARDIEQQINRGLENNVSSVSEFTKDFCRDQQSEIRDLLRQQQKEVETSFVYQTSKQSDKLLKQSQEQNLKSCKDMKKEIAGKLDIIQAKQQKQIDDNDKQFRQLRETFESSEIDRPWLNDNVPKPVQEQLNALHNTHMAEIKRLEKEIEQERKDRKQRKAESKEEYNRMGSLGDTGPLQNVYHFTEDESRKRRNESRSGSMFGKDSTFLSPRPPTGTAWSSKSLFARANPSPVATVLPQRKSNTENNQTKTAIQPPDHNETKGLFTRQLRSNSKQMNMENEEARLSFDMSDDACNTQDLTSTVEAYRKKNKYKGKTYRGKKSKPGTHDDQTEHCVTFPSRGSQQAVEQQNPSAIGLVKPVASVLSDVKQQSSSLNDFCDKPSPVQKGLRDTNGSCQIQPWSRNHSTTHDRVLMSPESGSSDLGSSSSSPSVSVTEVFIRRRIRHEAKTPTIKVGCSAPVSETISIQRVLDPCNCSSYYVLVTNPKPQRQLQLCLSGELWHYQDGECRALDFVVRNGVCNRKVPWDRCKQSTNNADGDEFRANMKSKCTDTGRYNPAVASTYDDRPSFYLEEQAQHANIELLVASFVAGFVIALILVAMVLTICGLPSIRLPKKFQRQTKTQTTRKKKFKVSKKSKVSKTSSRGAKSVVATDGDNVSVMYEDIDEEEDQQRESMRPSSHSTVKTTRVITTTTKTSKPSNQGPATVSVKVGLQPPSKPPPSLPSRKPPGFTPKPLPNMTGNRDQPRTRAAMLPPGRKTHVQQKPSDSYLHPQ